MKRLAIAGLLLSASCIRYVPMAVDPAANGARYQARSLSAPEVQALVETILRRHFEQWPPQTLDIDTLTAAAFTLNPDIAVARAEYATSIAAIKTAGERPNPTLNASIEHKASGPELSPWVTSFGLDLPIEWPAKRTNRITSARESAAAAQQKIAIAGWDARSRIRAALLDLYAAQLRLSTLKREESVQRDIVEVFSKRLELGESAQPDLSRARIALTQTSLLESDASRLASIARGELAAAVGAPLHALDSFSFDLSPFDTAPKADDSLREAALTGRADILAAVHEFAAADAALRLELARQYPDLHLGPGLGWDQGAKTWAIGAASELPLLNRHRGEIAEAYARRNEAAQRLTLLQARIVSAFDLAMLEIEAARQKLATADRIVAEEEQQVGTATKQFNAGESDRLTLRSSELELEIARAARADAWIDLQRAAGALEDALQRPLEGAALVATENRK